MKTTGRQAAVAALSKYRRAGAFSDMAVDSVIRESTLEPREAALCSRLVYGVLQNLAFLDFYIGQYSNTSLNRMEPKVLDILRISAYQILFMDRIPVSAAVSEGVALCNTGGFKRAAGLVNAVLRRIAENRTTLPVIPGEGTAEYLSVRYSHPLWLVNELIEDHGYEFARGFIDANNAEPPVFIQANTLKTTAEDLAARLAGRGVELASGDMPGSFSVSGAGRISLLPEFMEGLFYVQDDAARRAVMESGARPGMNVIDACAAPGGKSFAAAIQMENEGGIVSCDLHGNKLRRIEEGAARLGIDIISVREMDARSPDPDLQEWADVVIADAPCSGLGVIRKKPEIRYKDPEALNGLPEIQLSILEGLSECVKPGGILLYSTCTVRRRENEAVVGKFLELHGEYSADGMQTLWPHIHGTDGFFICRLIKST
ncbi:MAG: 16S rRNA (cytosine(967)-C(5))-methyltransferase RsmB [Clostridia bacterium]|nr:16S rRNA (cytosine(967)-C(5))-methyltransferase RsmB [Clostridia bacterium]